MTVSSREYQVLQIDAFTTHKFEGNAASVVLDAQGLSDDEMQRIAREMNNSNRWRLSRVDAAATAGVPGAALR